MFSRLPSLLHHLLTLILSSFIVLTNGEYLEYDVTSVAKLDFETIGDIVSGGTSDGFYTVNVPTRQAVLVEGSGTDASNTDAQIPYFTRL